jgi:cytochrome c biogenesis protein
MAMHASSPMFDPVKVAPYGIARWLAAPRWTVASFLLLAAGALAVIKGGVSPTPVILPPLTLLAVNLGAAVVAYPRFRTDLPLLLFHLALLALVGLFAIARLTYLDVGTMLSQGSNFDGTLVVDKRGPLHGDGLEDLDFVNEGFTVDYPKGGKYTAVYNRVSWRDSEGAWKRGVIGGDVPLVIGDYRVYTTSNRGFAPVFLWEPRDGLPQPGRVQLNEPEGENFAPVNSWTLPGLGQVWAMLDFTPYPDDERHARENLGAAELDHALVVRVAGERFALQPGEAVEFPAGRLTYVRLDSWMGYTIVYDPTRPWMIATVMFAVACLVWFYARKLLRRGWDTGE